MHAKPPRGAASLVYMQVMAASPPGYRVQFSGAHADDQCLVPDGRLHDARVDRNASLASAHVAAYTATLVAEIATRYPSVAGIRLDWPEYPPYDFRSALFDFNPAASARMADAGVDPRVVARDAADVGATACVRRCSVRRPPARTRRCARSTKPGSTRMFDATGPLAPLCDAKRDAARDLLASVRAALDRYRAPAAASSRRRFRRPSLASPAFRSTRSQASPTPSASSSTRCTGR